MAAQNATVLVFETPAGVEASVQRLRGSGFEMSRISVVARDSSSDVSVFCGSGGAVRTRGERGEFWNRMWQTLCGWAIVVVPGVGPVLTAGPLGGWTVATLENAAVFGGLSPLEAAIYSLGIPRERVRRYESALNAGKFLLVVHGASDEVEKAKSLLDEEYAESRT